MRFSVNAKITKKGRKGKIFPQLSSAPNGRLREGIVFIIFTFFLLPFFILNPPLRTYTSFSIKVGGKKHSNSSASSTKWFESKSGKNCFFARTRLHMISLLCLFYLEEAFPVKSLRRTNERASGLGELVWGSIKAENCTQAKEHKIEMKIIFYLFSITFFLIFRYHLIPPLSPFPGHFARLLCVRFSGGSAEANIFIRTVGGNYDKSEAELRCFSSTRCGDFTFSGGKGEVDEDERPRWWK